MQSGAPMPHSQGISNNPYPDQSIQSHILTPIYLIYILIESSRVRLGIPKGPFPASLPVKISKELLSSSVLDICSLFLNLLDLVNLILCPIGKDHADARC